jgi:flagellar basal body-associated protein FliL
MKRERRRTIIKKLIAILIVILFVLLIGRVYHTLYYFSTTSIAKTPTEKKDSLVLAVTDSLALPLDSITKPGSSYP